MHRTTMLTIAVIAALGSGCGQTDTVPEGQEVQAAAVECLTVYAVNYPLVYLAERIGGEAVEVVFPAPGLPQTMITRGINRFSF